jgi:hypothetical protein
MNHSEFVNVVVNGRKNDAANYKVMPSFGTNPNVMCYLTTFSSIFARAPTASSAGGAFQARG